MKKILIVGSEEAVGYAFAKRMHNHGFKVRRIRSLLKASRILKNASPDFVMCAGKIGLDTEGSYYLEI